MGAEWLGGNMKHQGGGYKVNLLKKAIQPLKDTQTIILFTDRFDFEFRFEISGKIIPSFVILLQLRRCIHSVVRHNCEKIQKQWSQCVIW